MRILFIIILCIAVSDCLAQVPGPEKPSTIGITPVSTSGLVDESTGDLNYSPGSGITIPGPGGGFTFALSYSSNEALESQVSEVGNFRSTGTTINRVLRGVPDDFWGSPPSGDGDVITRSFYQSPNLTIGFGIPAKIATEVFGYDVTTKSSLFVSYNTINGVNADFKIKDLKAIKTEDNVDPVDTTSDEPSEAELKVSFYKQNGVSWKELCAYKPTSKQNQNDKKSLKDLLGSNLVQNSMELGQGIIENSVSPLQMSDVPYSNFNTSFNFHFDPNSTVPGELKTTSFNGIYNKQIVAQPIRNLKANGIMHTSEMNKTNSISDFYRAADFPTTEKNPSTHYPVQTQDIFSSALVPSFKIYTNQFGIYHTQEVRDYSSDVKAGLSLSTGFGFDIGLNAGYSSGVTRKGPIGNPQRSKRISDFQFHSRTNIDGLYEPYSFRVIGENTPQKKDFWIDAEKSKPLAFDLGLSLFQEDEILPIKPSLKTTVFSTYNQGEGPLDIKPIRDRVNRNTIIQDQSRKQLRTNYFDLHVTEKSGNGYRPLQKISYNQGKDHHLNGFRIIESSGIVKEFFLPQYVINQSRRTFSINLGNNRVQDGEKIVGVNLQTAKIKNNVFNEYYSDETIDPYAEAFHITSIKSADYVDCNQNGVLDQDDCGEYLKFVYEKSNKNFKYRYPFEENQGLYAKNYYDNKEDDLVTQRWGETEEYYVKAIISKHHVMVFQRSSSKMIDASKTTPRPKLDKVCLYSVLDPNYTKDFYLDESIPWPTPIQCMEMEYDYLLKEGIPNTTNGVNKSLTLTKLFYTYQNSKEGSTTPYEFDYYINPSVKYNEEIGQTDAWGTLQQNWENRANGRPSIYNTENPFTIQDEDYPHHKDNVSAWKLNKVTLPSGGEIEVEYENDVYNYEQDKVATQFYEIIGIGENPSNYHQLVSTAPSNSVKLNDKRVYIFFKTPHPVQSDDDVIELVKGMKETRVKAFMNLKHVVSSGLQNSLWREYIDGYVEISPDDAGRYDSRTGWVKLKTNTPLKNSVTQIHPFQLLAIQHILTRSDLDGVIQLGVGGQINPVDFINQYITPILDKLKKDYYGKSLIKGHGNKIAGAKPSYILLKTQQNYGKKAGTARVKSINFSSNDSFNRQTGVEYIYQNQDGSLSGVASSEPSMIVTESATNEVARIDGVKHPILLANEGELLETGYRNMAFLPAPQVTYESVITVPKEHSGLTQNQTGIIINEFYTAKEYPLKIEVAEKELAKSIPIAMSNKDWGSAFPIVLKASFKSNGYSSGISIDDKSSIYGKKKSTASYHYVTDLKDLKDPVSKTVFKYNKMPFENPSFYDEEGVSSNEMIGTEIQFYGDQHEDKATVVGGGADVNVIFSSGLFMASITPNYFTFGEHTTTAVVTTKEIDHYAVLDKIESYRNGAKIETTNESFDPETGYVVHTSVTDEFLQKKHSLDLIGHTSYSRMKSAGKNIDARFRLIPASGGNYQLWSPPLLTTPLVEELFFPGDEIQAENSSDIYYVESIDPANQTILIEDALGNLAQNIAGRDLHISRSGYRNLLNRQKGKVVSLTNPLDMNLRGFEPFETWNELPQTIDKANVGTPWETICEYEVYYSMKAINSNFNQESYIITKVSPIPGESCEIIIENSYVSNIDLNQYRLDQIIASTDTNYRYEFIYSLKNDPNSKVSFFTSNDFSCLMVDCNKIINTSATQYTEYWQYENPPSGQDYATGKKGIPREQFSYVYYDEEREQAGNLDMTIRPNMDGQFNYIPFAYRQDTTFNEANQWKYTTEITKVNQNGQVLETKNRMQIYSSSLLGYNEKLAIAIAQNARNHEIVSENFESYDFPYQTRYTGPGNGNMDLSYYELTKHTGHTGNKAQYIDDGVSYESSMNPTLNSKFRPLPDKKYIISSWYMDELNGNGKISVYADGALVAESISSGNEVDGFERLVCQFTIPSGTSNFKILFHQVNDEVVGYIDDIAIQPFESAMTKYVYDPTTYQVIAILDDNHYTNFFIYDEEGNLTQTRIETEEGIKTISTSQTHIK